MKTLQEVAELVCDAFTDMELRPYATGHGIEWNCEIIMRHEDVLIHAVLTEGANSPEDAANSALEEFQRTLGPHMLQAVNKT